MRQRPRGPCRLGAVAAAAAFSLVAPAGASEPKLRLLDVPFLSQGVDLCGGAAAAMVLRYWGVPAATEDFAPLVDPRRRGIPTSALLLALRQRGLQAVSFRAGREQVQGQLARGRPVIGLIGVGNGLLHYVVLLAWADGRVLLHDPARAPFRVYRERELLEAWRKSDDWALVVTSAGPAEAAPAGAAAPPAAQGLPCGELVAEGVALARAGEQQPAETRLQAAAALCPLSAAPVLEMAGLRFQAQRWRDAAQLAEQATRRDPGDAHAWRTLAASLYLSGDGRGALGAFNRFGEPKLGLLRIDGLTRTRFASLERRLGAQRESLLTARDLDRARRRLQDLPALRSSRVGYRPTRDGHADLEVAVVERPLFPGSVAELVRLAARAGNEREVELGVASPAGSGELVSLAWRFPEPRPAFGLSVVAPQPFGIPALLRAGSRWDTQSYARGGDAPPLRERQREVSLALSDWTRAGVRWELGASLQRFAGRGSFLGPSLALEARAAEERLALRARAAAWLPAQDRGEGFRSLELGAAWRSGREEAAPLRLRAEWRVASSDAPLLHWPGAGTGAGRPQLLRAHPLLSKDVVAGRLFGRRLASFGVEWEPLQSTSGPLRVGLALFADAASAARRLEPGRATHADAGLGLRLRLPGTAGAVRVDFARGLRDGRHAISAGWLRAWPGFWGS